MLCRSFPNRFARHPLSIEYSHRARNLSRLIEGITKMPIVGIAILNDLKKIHDLTIRVIGKIYLNSNTAHFMFNENEMY